MPSRTANDMERGTFRWCWSPSLLGVLGLIAESPLLVAVKMLYVDEGWTTGSTCPARPLIARTGEDMFFDNWHGIARAVVVGVFAYVGLVVLLRGTGKRTLSKLNAFDLVVTVALGSTLATVLLTERVALAEGLTGLSVLILLQLAVTWLSVRFATVRRLVRAEPTLLYFRGHMLRSALAGQRVTEGEVLQAVRANGLSGLEQVEAVVLEADGSLSVVRPGGGLGAALRDVPAVEPGRVEPARDGSVTA